MLLALFVALFCSFNRPENIPRTERFAYAFIGALLASAIPAYKMVSIIFCAIYLGLTYGARLFYCHIKKEITFELLIFSGLTFFTLLPWMISSYQSSGTMFYPLLGQGYHSSAYGYIYLPPLTFKRVIYTVYKTLSLSLALFTLVWCFMIIVSQRKKSLLQPVCICISVLIGLLTINILFGLEGTDRYRYVSPFFFASISYVVLYFFSGSPLLRKKRLKTLPYLAIIVFLPYLLLRESLGRRVAPGLHKVFLQYGKNILTGIRKGNGLSPYHQYKQRTYRKAQYAVPAGEIILSRLEAPFLLDFKRNQIFIIKYPALGPYPGMPILRGAEPVADYLLLQGIKYIIYCYAGMEKARQRKEIIKHFKYTKEPWIKEEVALTYKFDDILDQLGVIRERVYDNGEIFVLDLSKKLLK
jgi:hypothetical protein